MPHRKAVYVKAPNQPCRLYKIVNYDSIENGALKQSVLENMRRVYLDKHRSRAGLNRFQAMAKYCARVVRHEVHEIDQIHETERQGFPQLDEIVLGISDPRIENYVGDAYRSACMEGIRNAEASARKWNKWKEIANIYLPVPLGLAAFFTGVATGTDGVAWAAAAEFGPYLGIPPAIWFERKEHKLRHEIEELEETTVNGELEEKRTAMGKYNTAKDVCSFWMPVTFDGTLTGLSYSHIIPTPAHYMTGIVAMPYIAHGLGAFALAKEYACEEKEAMLRKMMNTPVVVADDAFVAKEIVKELEL